STLISDINFNDPKTFNYHINYFTYPSWTKASDPGSAGDFSLLPTLEYAHLTDSAVRYDKVYNITVGAFSIETTGVKDQNKNSIIVLNFPNPFSGKTTIDLGDAISGEVTINVYNPLG